MPGQGGWRGGASGWADPFDIGWLIEACAIGKGVQLERDELEMVA